jgi:hypothetical protein
MSETFKQAVKESVANGVLTDEKKTELLTNAREENINVYDAVIYINWRLKKYQDTQEATELNTLLFYEIVKYAPNHPIKFSLKKDGGLHTFILEDNNAALIEFDSRNPQYGVYLGYKIKHGVQILSEDNLREELGDDIYNKKGEYEDICGDGTHWPFWITINNTLTIRKALDTLSKISDLLNKNQNQN